MEEYIEILNTFLLANIPEIITQKEFDDVKQAIKNLIKEYKELEEKNIKLQKRNNRQFKLFGKRDKEIENLKNTNKTLYELCQGKAMQEFINNECDYIPKSKVIKKIQQLKMNADYDWKYKYDYQDVIKILEELLEERN